MYTKKEFRKRLRTDFLIAIVGAIALAIVLFFTLMNITLNRQSENFDIKLNMAAQKTTNYINEANDDLNSFDRFSQAKVDVLAYYYSRNFDKSTSLDDMSKQWELKAIYIIDKDNNIVSKTSENEADEVINKKVLDEVSEITPLNIENNRYYIANINDDYRLLGCRDYTSFNTSYEYATSPEKSLKNIKIGLHGYIIAVNLKDNTIEYSPTITDEGRKISELNLDKDILNEDDNSWIEYDGVSYYSNTKVINGEYAYVALCPQNEIIGNFNKMFFLSLLVYFIIVCIIICYINFLRVDHQKKYREEAFSYEYYHFTKNLSLEKRSLKKIRDIIVLGLIFTFAMTYYFQSLSLLSSQELKSETKIKDISVILDENKATLTRLEKEYNDEYLRRVQNIAVLIKKDPGLLTNDNLDILASRAQISSLYVFDSNGKVTATSTAYSDFVLSDDPDDQSFEFWDIIKGYSDDIVQDATKSDSAHEKYIQYIGTKRLDTNGMVQAGLEPGRLEDRIKKAKVDHVLTNIAVENDGIAFAVDKKSNEFIYYPEEKFVGRDATKYGLSKSALNDEYSGYQTINNTEYFVASDDAGSYYIYIAAPVSFIMSGRMEVSIINTIVNGIILIIISIFALIDRNNKILNVSNNEELLVEDDEVEDERTDPNDDRVFWKDKTPEQKLGKVLRYLIGIICVLLVLYMINSNNSYNPNDILSYIINLKWERTISIFSITYIILIVAEVVVVTTVIRKILSFAASNMGNKAQTIIRLINNFIKYFAVIGSIMYCLNFVGFDSSAIWASAGLLSLVIGLGAQSMIGDILAGVFIVFEGEFRVGDIIMIDDWRGKVLEIGIRATKIEDINGNIKILNNSKITGVINMTKRLSYTSVDIGIDYGESLERVESILSKEMPNIKAKLPAIIDGPNYKGVVELADSSVVIKISCQCSEGDSVQLKRDLNREVKLLFDKYGINIPYPQVVLHEPTVYKKASAKDKKLSQELIDEQRSKAKEKQGSDE